MNDQRGSACRQPRILIFAQFGCDLGWRIDHHVIIRELPFALITSVALLHAAVNDAPAGRGIDPSLTGSGL